MAKLKAQRDGNWAEYERLLKTNVAPETLKLENVTDAAIAQHY